MGLEYHTYAGSTPNDYYRDLAQAFINASWTNTAAKTPDNGAGNILEQSAIGSDQFNCIDAWVKNTVGDVTSGARDSADFVKIYFRDIDHYVPRGLYYKFNNSWYICNEFGHFSGIAQDAGLRRCNNFIRIIDPENGGLFTIPCVVEYTMQSPNISVGRYVATPNNHAVVICQGNADTQRLFKLNTRYILGGRPFKLYAWQNALNLDLTTNFDTLVYLDLYLDEIHDGDDLAGQVAYNGDFNYAITINSPDTELAPEATGTFTATVTLNGDEVDRPIIWSADNKRIIDIAQDGKYTVYGEVGDEFILCAELSGNQSVKAYKPMTIAEATTSTPVILLDKEFGKIRQTESIRFSIQAEYNGELYTELSDIDIQLDAADGIATLTQIDNTTYELTCIGISSKPIQLRITASVAGIEVGKTYAVQTVSMFG